MKSVRLIILLAGLGFAGGASAAMPVPAMLGVDGMNAMTEGLLQEAQYRHRGRPRCFVETRRVRFVDRFGRLRVRIVERRVCR